MKFKFQRLLLQERTLYPFTKHIRNNDRLWANDVCIIRAFHFNMHKDVNPGELDVRLEKVDTSWGNRSSPTKEHSVCITRKKA